MIAVRQVASESPETSTAPNREAQKQRSLDQACEAARIMDEYRGQNTVVLDLTAITPIVDYFVITTGSSSRQMKAIAEEVHRAMKAQGSKRIGREGEESNTWLLQDFGDVVVHVFTPEARELYDLEHLWADAPHIDWKTHCGVPVRDASA